MSTHLVLTSHYGDSYHLHQCIKSVIVSFQCAGITDYKHLVFIDGLQGKNSDFSLDSFCYPNVEFHISSKNVGKSSAFNIMLSNSDCQYLFFLDSDDLFFPSKISQQSLYLESNDVILGTNYFSYHQSSPNIFLYSDYPCSDFLIRSSFIFFPYLLFSSFSCRFSTLANFSLTPFDESLSAGIDYNFYSNLFTSSQVANLLQPLVYYRINPNGMTKTTSTRKTQISAHLSSAKNFLLYLNPLISLSSDSDFLVFLLFSSKQLSPGFISSFIPDFSYQKSLHLSHSFLMSYRELLLSKPLTAAVYQNMSLNLKSWSY